LLFGLAIAISLTFLGGNTNQYASRAAVAIQRAFYDPDERRMWREQKERQQRIAREVAALAMLVTWASLEFKYSSFSLNGSRTRVTHSKASDSWIANRRLAP
jgi:hypothetical protein